MANPLPNEEKLYKQIKDEGITIAPGIWDLLYHRIGDDITAINLICQFYATDNQDIPVAEGIKILTYTKHIRDIVNQITLTAKEDSPFPEFIDELPLHPILRDLFTHYVGNDIYVINLIVQDTIDPNDPHPISPQLTQRIIDRVEGLREFLNKLRVASSQK